jgi:hypothetical protein
VVLHRVFHFTNLLVDYILCLAPSLLFLLSIEPFKKHTRGYTQYFIAVICVGVITYGIFFIFASQLAPDTTKVLLCL